MLVAAMRIEAGVRGGGGLERGVERECISAVPHQSYQGVGASGTCGCSRPLGVEQFEL